MKRFLAAVVVAFAMCHCHAACGGKVITKVNLTPAQLFDAAKVVGVGSATTLSVIVTELSKEPEKNARKLAIYKKALAGLEKFNASVRDTDFTAFESWGAARDELFKLADNLLKNDVAGLNDPALTAELTGGLEIVMIVCRAFDRAKKPAAAAPTPPVPPLPGSAAIYSFGRSGRACAA